MSKGSIKDQKTMDSSGFTAKQATLDDSITQCKFYLPKKSRLCRFRPKPGQTYCPEHACVMGIQGQRKRIPCPLNPSHNCYEDELEKHKRKCNVTRIQAKLAQAVYYMKGVNRGTSGSQECPASENQICVRDLTADDLAKVIDKVQRLYNAHVEPIKQEHFQHPCVQEELDSSGKQDLNFILKDQAALRKELMQQAALIGQMEKEELLENERTCFVELGAGKGKLSHWINKASRPNSKQKFLLVERGSVRYKMDGYLKQSQGEAYFQRIKIDIEDLHLGKVPELDPQDTFVVVGKHLCGGATDMGIRCAVNTLVFGDKGNNSTSLQTPISVAPEKGSSTRESSKEAGEKRSVVLTSQQSENSSKTKLEDQVCEESNTSPSNPRLSLSSDSEQKANPLKPEDVEGPPAKTKKMEGGSRSSSRLPKGILIALCCHHRCTWDTYVGKPFMEECGVSPQEFDLMTRLSSWATCARARVQPKTNPPKGAQDGLPMPNISQSNAEQQSAQGRELEATLKEHETEDLVTIPRNSNLTLREQLSVPERERIGRLCKRLIDTGRIHHLRSRGMKVFLREYVSEELTPENVVLIAQS